MQRNPLTQDSLDNQDAKLRVFHALKKTYDKLDSNQKLQQDLNNIFQFNFSNDGAVGRFLHLSIRDVNLALTAMQPLYSNNEVSSALADLTFSKNKDKNKFIKVTLPNALSNKGNYYQLVNTEDPCTAQTDIKLMNDIYYEENLPRLKNRIHDLNNELDIEISNLINSCLQDHYNLTGTDSNLFVLYMDVLSTHAENECSAVNEECLNFILHLKEINFDEIKSTIQTSLGLTKSNKDVEPVKSYIQLTLKINQLKGDISDNTENVKADFSYFIKYSFKEKNEQLERMKSEADKLEAEIECNNRKKKILDKLDILCKQETTIFNEQKCSPYHGYFNKLKDDLSQDINPSNPIYKTIYTSTIALDDASLKNLMRTHASYIKQRSQLEKNETSQFEMEDTSGSDMYSEPAEDTVNLSSQEIDDCIHVVIETYANVFSGQNNDEFDLTQLAAAPETIVQTIQFVKEIVNVKEVKNAEADAEVDAKVKSLAKTPRQTVEVEKNHSIPVDAIVDHNSHSDQLANKTSLNTLEEEAIRSEIEAQFNLKTATLNRQYIQLSNANNKLVKDCSELQKTVCELNNANTILQNNNTLLKQAKDTLEKTNLAIQAENTKLQAGLDKTVKDLALKKLQDESNSIIKNFNLFYEDYKNHTSTELIAGLFHGNKGRLVAKKFKKAFDVEFNKLNIDYSQGRDFVIQSIQTVFRNVVQQEEAILSGNYRPHSFKTYLLAYNDYLSSLKNNEVNKTSGDIVKNTHADKYVGKTSTEIKKLYDKFPGKIKDNASIFRFTHGNRK